MVEGNDIVDRLEAAADLVPEELSRLLIEAADEIRHLRDLFAVRRRDRAQGRQAAGQGLKPVIREMPFMESG